MGTGDWKSTMKRVTRLLIFTVLLGVGIAAIQQTGISPATISPATAQEVRNPDVPGPADQRLDAGVPSAAFLTDRGRALVENLRNLRRTRANLGPKHPTLPVIDKAILETEQQLRAWLPDESAEENPFKKLDAPPQRARPATDATDNAAMNDTDLRQLVLRLHGQVEALEARVRTLERSPK